MQQQSRKLFLSLTHSFELGDNHDDEQQLTTTTAAARGKRESIQGVPVDPIVISRLKLIRQPQIGSLSLSLSLSRFQPVFSTSLENHEQGAL